MFKFNDADVSFAKMAADPIRRREMIVNYTSRRNKMFYLSILSLFLLIAEYFFRPSGITAITVLLVVTFWIEVSHFDSVLKLLRTIEQIDYRKNNPNAEQSPSADGDHSRG